MPELTVIIPTHNRRAVVCETLARLERQRRDVNFEAIVVDDASTDDTPAAVEQMAGRVAFDLTLLRGAGRGPAAARNLALGAARAPVCLFIDDDTWPRPGLLARHRDFHRRHPEPTAALIGFTDLADDPPPSPFMRWVAQMHLGFDAIEDPGDVGGRNFLSGNASAKVELVRAVGGFDEGYPSPAHEDVDLGLRMEAAGMRLAFDREAAVEHYHPTDLASTIRRMRDVGYSLARSVARHPGREEPTRPGARHRLKATLLTCLVATGVRNDRVTREVWRFLCHESTREGYWSAADPSADGGGRGGELRIGRRLARLAARDPDTWMPPAPPELDAGAATREPAPAP